MANRVFKEFVHDGPAGSVTLALACDGKFHYLQVVVEEYEGGDRPGFERIAKCRQVLKCDGAHTEAEFEAIQDEL